MSFENQIQKWVSIDNQLKAANEKLENEDNRAKIRRRSAQAREWLFSSLMVRESIFECEITAEMGPGRALPLKLSEPRNTSSPPLNTNRETDETPLRCSRSRVNCGSELPSLDKLALFDTSPSRITTT